MAVEKRATCEVVRCDTPSCHAELLGPTRDEAFVDALTAGWAFAKGQHVCPDCCAGRSTAEARSQAAYGLSRVIVRAPRAYAEGEEVYAEDGTLVGHAAAAARAGDPLEVVLRAPTAPGRQAEEPAANKPLKIQEVEWKPPWASERPS